MSEGKYPRCPECGLSAGHAERCQRGRDLLPCPSCGGDRLRADFTGSGRCHVARSSS